MEVDAGHIYFRFDSASIRRTDLAGLGTDSIPAGSACGLALGGSFLYWGNTANGTNTIGRVNPDTAGPPVQNFVTNTGIACGVAVDAVYVYWAEYLGGTIGRAEIANPMNKDPSFIQLGSGAAPCGLAIHGPHLYWAEQGNDRIGRANLDGTGLAQDFITGADGPCGVAVDALAPSVPAPEQLPSPTPISLPTAALGALGFSHTRFRAADTGATISGRRRRAPVGTRITYTDSQPATTRFTVAKRAPGVKRGARCLKRTKKRRKGTRCTRHVARGSFSHVDKAGTNTFRFSGRLKNRKLRPGRYRLRAVPSHQGHEGKARTRRFRIVR